MIPRPCTYAGLVGIEVDGPGPTLLALHGNSASSQTFLPLWAEPSLAGLRRVALDLPGHGASAVPARVTVAGLVSAVAAAVAAVGATSVFGHSLSGHLLLQAMAQGLLSGVERIAVLGTPPLAGTASFELAFRPLDSLRLLFQATLDEHEARRWATDAFYPAPAQPWFIQSLQATHRTMRPGLGESMARDGLRDEAALLKTSPVPIAVLHAEQDPFLEADYLAALAGPALWGGAVRVLPGVGHYAPWDAPAQVAEVLSEFLLS